MKHLKQRSNDFQIKKIDDTGEFTGYASVFGNIDSYDEIVEPGAFTKSLEDWKSKGRMPALLWQHDPHEPVGAWLEMRQDERGLYARGKILVDAGDLERRAYEHLKAKSVSGLSIGYSVPKGGYELDKSGIGHIREANLWETSIVTFPANPDAQIEAVRSELTTNPKEMERRLRDVGLSRSEAKAFMAEGYSAIHQRDAGEGGEEDEAKLLAVIADLTKTFKGA